MVLIKNRVVILNKVRCYLNFCRKMILQILHAEFAEEFYLVIFSSGQFFL